MRWSIFPGLLLGSAWTLLVAMHYRRDALHTELWIMVLPWFAAAWCFAVIATVGCVILLWVRKHWWVGLTTFVSSGVVAFVIVQTPWTDVYATTWYALHRDDFREVASIARRGELGDRLQDYYGAPLPSDLDHVSVNAKVVAIGECGGSAVLFIPTWIGIPDDAVGYVHLACSEPPPDLRLDGFGMVLEPERHLGDGWWWADAPGES